MRVALALSVLTVFACSNTSPQVTDPGVGDPIGSQPGRLPDGGFADAGTDAGTTADAGNPCDTQVLPLGSVTVNDACVLPGVTTPTTATIQPNGCNDVKVFLADGFNCSGVLTGASNFYVASCSTLPCAGPLPGTLVCTQQSGLTCTIQICSGINCP
ncbi:MAG: hypothetical protein ACJ79V_21890 [Myxococcales bacterium]